MKLHLFILVMLISFFTESCDYYDNGLKIQNNGDHAIALDYSLDTIPERRNNEDISFFIRDKILPGEIVTKTKPGSTKAWQFQIQKSINKKLNVFIINIDTLIKYQDWEYIKEKRLYRRYELSEEDLEKRNWTIEYP